MFKAFVNMFKYIILFLTIIFIGLLMPSLNADAQTLMEDYQESDNFMMQEDIAEQDYQIMNMMIQQQQMQEQIRQQKDQINSQHLEIQNERYRRSLGMDY